MSDTRLRRISEHLYLYEDTCLVYVLVDGDRALLVDSGSGAVLEAVEQLGVRQIEWVLHTHHHRDQCQGDPALIAHGARLAVPHAEAQFFEQITDVRAHSAVYDNYYLGSDTFSISNDVPVAHRLADYRSFTWGSYTFRVIPTPGHTQGSITLLADIDGQTVAFTGDLIAAPGRVWQIHALQWQYAGGWGEAEGIQTSAVSLAEVRAAQPDLLLPSHGTPMDDPPGAIDALLASLRGMRIYLDGSGFAAKPGWLVSDRPLTRLSQHLWMNPHSLANSYALVADSGHGLIVDYGYPSLAHFSGRFRFAEHMLRDLRTSAGLTVPEVFLPTHYHDDHVVGVPLLQERYGVQVWAHAVLADILRHPRAYNLPCLLPRPIDVARELHDGETFTWRGFRFTIAHTPGHTYYASSILAEVDGLRFVFTGDNLHLGPLGPILGGPIYRNRYSPGDFERSFDQLLAWEPDYLLTGHAGAIAVERPWIEAARDRARRLDSLLNDLSYEPAAIGFALDPDWVALSPFQHTAVAGDWTEMTVTLRNHLSQLARAVVRLIVPDGWQVEPQTQAIQMSASGETTLRFGICPPSGASVGQHVVCVDVELDDGTVQRRFGQVAEGRISIAGGTHPM